MDEDEPRPALEGHSRGRRDLAIPREPRLHPSAHVEHERGSLRGEGGVGWRQHQGRRHRQYDPRQGQVSESHERLFPSAGDSDRGGVLGRQGIASARAAGASASRLRHLDQSRQCGRTGLT